jgi:hypothetical protein
VKTHIQTMTIVCGFVCAASLNGQQYNGPVVDAHAHVRLGESDGLLKTQPIGADTIVRWTIRRESAKAR